LVLLQSCSWNTVLLVSLMQCFSLKLLCGLKNLQKFSPWEIVRHDVVYPIRFFGKVQAESDGSRKCVGGEVMQALAYDVPIPGYMTKNTISLRIWEAKAPPQDFDLYSFNSGEHEKAAILQSKANQICAVLYPGDATEDGKLLRLKQQYLLCSASLQV
jgi:starch phosphorylase